MLDNRKALETGYELTIENHKYIILNKIGKGSSCIVYGAKYVDSADIRHKVRIKECYPYNMAIKRNEKGELVVSEENREKFEKSKENFYKAYEENVILNNLPDLTNSTPDAINIYELNHTWYIVMTYVEGEDYRTKKEDNLQSVFIRIRTLSYIIEKYHQRQILHLDIKPENIIIIPETKEHMLLLDFDSLLKKEERNNPDVRISYSDGFAAPELKEGKRNLLCEATDIFSIGAVLFFKLFGRKPKAWECGVTIDYDFRKMIFQDERYQPYLFEKLQIFLHRILSPDLSYRYKNLKEMLHDLEELIDASDVEGVFVYDNFHYNTACFIGRQPELEEISKRLGENCVLFLSGIGGIGKSELAKRYAYENRKNYRKIIFLPFEDSIRNTINHGELKINRFEEIEKESEEALFERKLSLFLSLVTEQDLCILDNFDVDMDENLERLLDGKCQFLITTRQDYRDYNYEQIEVETLESLEELLWLFGTYNTIEYEEKERKNIEGMIELVEYHTMTVELIAKYLRDSKELPGVLLQKMMEKEGVTNTSDLSVKQRKDKRLRAESVTAHLTILFDLFAFSNREREMMESLSLLGYIRIRTERFLELCKYQGNESDLVKLVHRGWIEYEEEKNKISLHQVILDLVYHHLKPTSEQCPNLMNAMQAYTIQKMPNQTERMIKKKLLGYFVSRVSGNDETYAKFLVTYCKYMYNRYELLEQAETICRQADSKTSKGLLKEICLRKIKLLSEELFLEDNSWLEWETFLEQKAEKMWDLAQEAIFYAKEYFETDASMAQFYVELAYLLDEAAQKQEIFLEQKDSQGLNFILDRVQKLLETAHKLLLDCDMSFKEKIKLFEKIQEFYLDDNFTFLYQSEHYADPDKALYYQRILDELHQKKNKEADKEVLSLQTISYEDCGDQAAEDGEYEKAVDYYLKSMDQDPFSLEDWILTKLASVYQKMGRIEDAIRCFKQVMKIDQKNGVFSFEAGLNLADLMLKVNDRTAALGYCDRIIAYYEERIEEDRETSLEYLILVYFKKYEIELEEKTKELFWKKCCEYFLMRKKEEALSESLVDFLEFYANKMFFGRERICYLLEIGTKYQENYCREVSQRFFKLAVLESETKQEYCDLLVLALLRCCELENDSYFDEYDQAMRHGMRAKEIYEASNLSDEYLKNAILRQLGECYFNLGDYESSEREKKKCNYFLLASHEAEDQTEEKKIELWSEAANAYVYVDQYEEAERCYEQLFYIWNPILGKYNYSSFDSYWSLSLNRLRGYHRLGQLEKMYSFFVELYQKAVHYYVRESKKEEIKSFCCHLRELSGCLIEAGFRTEGILLAVFGVILFFDEGLGEMSFLDLLPLEKTEVKNIIEIVVEELHTVFHGKVTDEKIDAVIETYERMKKELEEESFARIKEEFEWFAGKYQHQTIEFKR